MKIKKIISLILATTMVFTLATGCSSKTENTGATDQPKQEETKKESDKIVMYTNAEYPPFEYFEGDKIVGADVDIAEVIAETLGKELEVVHVEFESIIPAVTSGRGDFGAAGLCITPERAESVDFSIPYSTSCQNVIYKDGTDFDSLEKLAGQKIGVQIGTTSDQQITEAIANGVLKDTGAECMQYADSLTATQDLIAGRITAVVVDQVPAQEIVKQNEGLSTKEIESWSEKLAICVNKGNTELLDKINEVLQKLMDEGKIDEFLEAHKIEE